MFVVLSAARGEDEALGGGLGFGGWELPIKDAHFYEKYHQQKKGIFVRPKGKAWRKEENGAGGPRELMPAKRLPHLLGFLASFKNHSSSRHHRNPIQLARPLRPSQGQKFRQWRKLCQKPFASNGLQGEWGIVNGEW